MNENYKLTIHCITYNHEKYIKKALDSFLMQKTNFKFQVLVGDDVSTDKTRDIISEYATKYPDIIKPVFRDKNIGVIPNFVDISDRIKTEYVAMCEGDDYFTDENKLQKQVDFLEANPDCSMCFHPVKVVFAGNEKEDKIFPNKKYWSNDLTIDDLIKSNFIQTNSAVYRWRFRNEDVKKFFPLDIMPGDRYLHLLHAKVGKIGFIPDVMSNYLKHDAGEWSGGRDKINSKYGIERFKFHLNIMNNFVKEKDKYDLYLYASEVLDSFIRLRNYKKIFQMYELYPKAVEDRFNNILDIFEKQDRHRKYPRFLVRVFSMFIFDRLKRRRFREKYSN